jgi:hypothetical protein
MIISVHVPKTAGTTLLHYLQTHFNVFEDNEAWGYASLLKAMLKKSDLVKTYDCIHGHFPAMKYRFYPNTIFITFVREPLERMVSHYYYWKKVYEIGNPGRDPYVDSLFKRDISLSDFVFEEKLKNQQWQYVRGIPLSRYSFIGITDEKYLANDMNHLFNEILRRPLRNSVIERHNKTDYNKKSISNIDMEAFRKFHKKDYEIYEYALQKRKVRLADPNTYNAT